MFVLNIRLDRGVQQAYSLFRNIDDSSDVDAIRDMHATTVSMAGV